MKAHLATLPLPPKPHQQPPQQQPHHSLSASFSYSSSSESEQEHEQEKAVTYGLRENPKKSFRLADPEFSFPADTGCVVVQDRESETESKNPTRRRSKRTRKSMVSQNTMELKKKPKLSFMESPPPPPPPPTEPAEPVSSVSDTSPEEDVAMCLMMLSRDRWRRRSVEEEEGVQKPKGFEEEEEQEIKLSSKRVRGGKQHQCENCGKTFRSSGALGSHKSICLCDEADANDKVFECPFCSKVFGSGQALGGHKRSHLMPSNANHSLRLKESFIDLNLPAPPEEDDLSVVSDA